MIELNMSYYYDNVPGDKETLKKQLDEYGEKIKGLFGTVNKSQIEIGCCLIELLNSKCYAYDVSQRRHFNSDTYKYELVPGEFRGNVCHSYFITYCQNELRLERSELSRYLNVADEFADIEKKCLKDEWKDYGFSQLVEMLPLTKEQRKKVKSSWTVKEIRAYKSSLVATSQKNKPSVQSVATSQRNDDESEDEVDLFESIMLISLQKFPKYERFYGLSPKRICDDYIELEAKYRALEAEVERLKAGNAGDDLGDDPGSDSADSPVIRCSGLSKGLPAIF